MTPLNRPEVTPESIHAIRTAPPGPTELAPLWVGRHVFVYGTLRRGQSNDITRLQPPPHFVGFATASGVMVHLGAYPGVILRPQAAAQAPIQGEVYRISAALERVLDGIEMIDPLRPDDQNGEYIKREIEVEVGAGVGAKRLVCLFYEINPRVALGKPVIGSGDWVRRQ